MALVIKSTLPENVGRVVVIETITDEQVVMLPTGKRVENPKGLVVCVIEADGLYTRSIWSKEISHGKFGAVPESWLMPLHKASAQSRREEALAA